MADPKPRVNEITHELLSVSPLFRDADGNVIAPPGLSLEQNADDSDVMDIVGLPEKPGMYQLIYRTSDVYGRVRNTDVDYDYTVESVTLVQPDIRVDFNDISDLDVERKHTVVLEEAIGNPEIVYAVTAPNPLPGWLEFDPATRELTVTENLTTVSETITYFACDSTNQTAQDRVLITAISERLQIPDQVVPAGVTTTYTLPLLFGGLTYSLTGLVAWTTFDPATRVLTMKTPTDIHISVGHLTYSISDGTTTKTASFRALRRLDVASVNDIDYFVGQTITDRLPDGEYGHPPYTRRVDGLTSEMTFNAGSRFLGGTFTHVSAGRHPLTYVVTDAVGQETSVKFNLAVAFRNPIVIPTITDAVYDIVDNVSLTLPVFTGGDGTLKLSVTGLPSELTFDSDTRVISGKLTAASRGSYTVTYSVVDGQQQTASVQFSLSVALLTALTFPDVENLAFEFGDVVSETLPAVTSGYPPYVYDLSGLPGDLNFNKATRVISGTLTNQNPGTHEVTYSVLDSQGRTVAQTFEIDIQTDLALPEVTDKTVDIRQPQPILLPSATGGKSPYVYSVDTQPAGMTFTASTRRITGTPSEVGTTTIVYTVTDANNHSVSQTFDIEVARFITLPAIADQFFQVGTSKSVTLPVAMQGSGDYGYEVGDIPVSLTSRAGRYLWNPDTRMLTHETGTSTKIGTAMAYYRATDNTSLKTASQRFRVCVLIPTTRSENGTARASTPVTPTSSNNEPMWTQNADISGNITVPDVFGGGNVSITISSDGTLTVGSTGVPDLSDCGFTTVMDLEMSYQDTTSRGRNRNTGSMTLNVTNLTLGDTVTHTNILSFYKLFSPGTTDGSGRSFRIATQLVTGTATLKLVANDSVSSTNAVTISGLTTATMRSDEPVHIPRFPNGYESGILSGDQTFLRLSAKRGTTFSETLPEVRGGFLNRVYSVARRNQFGPQDSRITSLPYPTWLNFDAATRVLSGTVPSNADTGTVLIDYEVSSAPSVHSGQRMLIFLSVTS